MMGKESRRVPRQRSKSVSAAKSADDEDEFAGFCPEWTRWYKDLVAFKEKHGHDNVPNNGKYRVRHKRY